MKQSILEAFRKLELKECEVCGSLISKKEFDSGDGACFKCWDKGNLN